MRQKHNFFGIICFNSNFIDFLDPHYHHADGNSFSHYNPRRHVRGGNHRYHGFNSYHNRRENAQSFHQDSRRPDRSWENMEERGQSSGAYEYAAARSRLNPESSSFEPNRVQGSLESSSSEGARPKQFSYQRSRNKEHENRKQRVTAPPRQKPDMDQRQDNECDVRGTSRDAPTRFKDKVRNDQRPKSAENKKMAAEGRKNSTKGMNGNSQKTDESQHNNNIGGGASESTENLNKRHVFKFAKKVKPAQDGEKDEVHATKSRNVVKDKSERSVALELVKQLTQDGKSSPRNNDSGIQDKQKKLESPQEDVRPLMQVKLEELLPKMEENKGESEEKVVKVKTTSRRRFVNKKNVEDVETFRGLLLFPFHY